MEQFLPIIIACLAALIALVAFILAAMGMNGFGGFKLDYEAQSLDMQRMCDSLRKQLADTNEGCKLLGRKIREQEKTIDELRARLDELSLTTQDSDSKLYSRAKKMISLGADINEVVRECEIPQAEAELLFRVQGKPVTTSNNSQIGSNASQPVPGTSNATTAKMPDFGGMTGISARVMQAEREAAAKKAESRAAQATSAGVNAAMDAPSMINDDASVSSMPKEASGLMEHFRNMQKP